MHVRACILVTARSHEHTIGRHEQIKYATPCWHVARPGGGPGIIYM